MVDSAKMNRRVTLQQPVASQAKSGQTQYSYQDVATVWASVQPKSGSESPAEPLPSRKTSYVVTIRYRPGITSEYKVRYGSKTLDITSVVDTEEEHSELVLSCIERV